MKPHHARIVLSTLFLGTVWFVTGDAHAGPPPLPPPVPQPTPSESPFEASIGFPISIPFPEGDVGARLPHGAEGVERGVDRVSAHIHPLKNIGAFGYIIPLSIELQKSRWLFQASGYEFQIARHFYADLGRYFGTDYSSGSFKYNVNLIGPQLELGANF